MKICRICKQNKNLTSFHKSKRHSFGVKNECSKCTNLYLRDRYKKLGRKDEVKKQLANNHLFRKYKITLEEYQNIYLSQKGCCAICNKHQKSLYNTRISKGKKEILVVDHDHLTNRIRGLLCQECNQALGLLKDDTTILINAIEYLSN